MNSFIPVSQPLFTGREKTYLNQCLDSGWISSEGPFVKEFEKKFSEFIGMPYGVAVSSGSAALDIAIELLNLQPGDEIILPTFSIVSPLFSILKAGGIPVFVDSDPITWNMETSSVEKKITNKTKAIIVVHTYGIPVDLEPIMKLVKKHDLFLIEDAAEVHGQKYNGKKCGSFGDMAIFSFYANKNINTGEGGMILMKENDLFERAKRLRNLSFHPDKPRFIHEEMGWNYRFTNMQAALGLAQLENLENTLSIKRAMGEFYNKELQFLLQRGFLLPVHETSYAQNDYWVFGLVCPNEEEREGFIKCLKENNIGYRPFFWSLHEQPLLKEYDFNTSERFPVSENLSRMGFYIPSGPGISRDELKWVSERIRKWYE